MIARLRYSQDQGFALTGGLRHVDREAVLMKKKGIACWRVKREPTWRQGRTRDNVGKLRHSSQ